MSAAPKFTPGPWYSGADFVSADCGDGVQRRIAFIVPITDGVREHFAIEQANARLIAAAPELYEALVAAENSLAWLVRFKGRAVSDDAETLAAVRAALAKVQA